MVKNILLLALSTFGRLEQSEYEYREETQGKEWEDRGKYYYQLEPVPRMLMRKLKKEEEKLDEILMLSTDACRKNQDISYGGISEKNISPQSFFEMRIRNYAREELGLTDPEIPAFHEIALNEKAPADAISETAKYLREVNSDSENDTVNLYLDTHGGFRGIQLVLEAIMSLLIREASINVVDIWGVQYGYEKPVSITNERDSFQIFDFVAGMNEFFNSGRTDSLKNFLGEGDTALLNILIHISEGIQLCHIKMFEDGLNDLQSYFNPEPHTSDPYLSLFLDNIQREYGKLLGKGRTVLDEIQWSILGSFSEVWK